MRIYDRNLTGAAGSETERTRETQHPDGLAGNSHTSVGRPDRDRVEFSQSMGQLSHALAQDSTHHAAKLQALAASYENGTYHTDSASIGKAMIADALWDNAENDASRLDS